MNGFLREHLYILLNKNADLVGQCGQLYPGMSNAIGQKGFYKMAGEPLDYCDDGGGGPMAYLVTDDVAMRFAQILAGSCIKNVKDDSITPRNVTVAIVASFPDEEIEIVQLYAMDWKETQWILKAVGTLSSKIVNLKYFDKTL